MVAHLLLRTKEHLDGLPSLSSHQLLQLQVSKEIHRRSSILYIAVFQQGGFAAKEQPMNSLAWCEKFLQQFLEQCSCYIVATPACKWGLDWYKTWAIAASSDRIQSLAGQCTHSTHQDFRGKRLPDGSFISALTAEYPSKLASAIVEIIKPWVSQSSSFNQDLTQWKQLLAKRPIARGPRITDGAGNNSSANWTIPLFQDTFKDIRKRWINRILNNQFHTRFVHACLTNQTATFITEEELTPFLLDLASSFPSIHWDTSIQDFQPFRLKLFHTSLSLAKDPDADIARHLQEGIPSGAFSPLALVGLWEANHYNQEDPPALQVCQDNWSSANQNPSITRTLIQQELDAGFIEEISNIKEAERRWPKGIALGKLGVVCADNRDPRLVLDSTICGMNGRCHLPEKQRLPNLRHVSYFLSTCPPLQEEWQGASINIKAAHKRMLIKEEEKGSTAFPVPLWEQNLRIQDSTLWCKN